MKITVITGADGEIIGTARFPQGSATGHPDFRPVAKSGQKVQEIELPSHLEGVQSAEELHRALKDHLRK